jgi:hypothetical protein
MVGLLGGGGVVVDRRVVVPSFSGAGTAAATHVQMPRACARVMLIRFQRGDSSGMPPLRACMTLFAPLS